MKERYRTFFKRICFQMNKKQFLFFKYLALFKRFHGDFYKISAILSPVPILFCILFPRPSFSQNPCSDFFPSSSLSSGRPLVKPVRTEAFRAYDEAVKAGYRSFLHIAPVAVGRSLVLSRALLRRIKNMEPGKKIIFVTVNRIHLVNQISSAIETLIRSKNLPPVRLINWNNKKEDSDNSVMLFLREVRAAVNRETDTPTVFFITSQSLKLMWDGLREKDSDLHRDLVSSLESLFLDGVRHYSASQTGRFLENLVDESGAFLFGSTATSVNLGVRLMDLFEVSYRGHEKVEYEIFVSRVLEAVEKGELDSNSIVKTYSQWQKNHPDMPSNPFLYYRGQFPGWTKLFGREKVEYEIFVSRVLEAVEKGELDSFRIKETYPQWEKNHPDMPSNPFLYYRGQFPGWTKLFGREKVEYEIFVSRVLEAVEKGELDSFRIKKTYFQWQKNHPDIPPNPYSYYRGQFPGWRKLLGRKK